PVVERTHAGQPEVLVLGARIDGAAEAGDQRGEAQGGPDARPFHVGDARPDIEPARPHLVESRRVHAPLVLRAADYRVEPDVRVEVALEDPRLRAPLEFD